MPMDCGLQFPTTGHHLTTAASSRSPPNIINHPIRNTGELRPWLHRRPERLPHPSVGCGLNALLAAGENPSSLAIPPPSPTPSTSVKKEWVELTGQLAEDRTPTPPKSPPTASKSPPSTAIMELNSTPGDGEMVGDSEIATPSSKIRLSSRLLAQGMESACRPPSPTSPHSPTSSLPPPKEPPPPMN
ncbi:hypothetical protein Dimus_029510 [Dionaea muscipula]